MTQQKGNLPQVVLQAEWQTALDALRVKEKEHMRASDAIAAERRRLPIARISKSHVFEGPDGHASLLDRLRLPRSAHHLPFHVWPKPG
jgi:predicted dithiol-disulfide oxidoreductase (DUF899 family)